MCRNPLLLAIASVVATTVMLVSTTTRAADCPAFLDHDFNRLHSSQSVNLCATYAGRPLLIVNTASH